MALRSGSHQYRACMIGQHAGRKSGLGRFFAPKERAQDASPLRGRRQNKRGRPARGIAVGGGTLSQPIPRSRLGVNHARKRVQRRRELPRKRGGTEAAWRADGGRLPEERPAESEVLQGVTRVRRAEPSTNGHANQWRERNWLPESDIARNTNWCARPESL